ncbi:MAG: hypothetical protein ACOCWQ_04010 [Nanoarchaeota archaeon]
MVLQFISIALEAAIVGIALMAARKRRYIYGIALTFSIYVFYDMTHLFEMQISKSVLRVVFFIANLSMLMAVWKLHKSNGK